MSLAKKLIPLLDRVLVEKVAARTKTVGGILLPETASSKARCAHAASAALRAARKRLVSPCVHAASSRRGGWRGAGYRAARGSGNAGRRPRGVKWGRPAQR